MNWTLLTLMFAMFFSAPAWSDEEVSTDTEVDTQAVRDYGFQKVIWVVLENTDRKDALKEPFLKELAERGALLANMGAEWHPSQPNYIAMISGNTHWVVGDYPVSLHGSHIGDLLENHNRTWKNYAEDFPGNCDRSATAGNYVRRHVPFMSFINVSRNPERCGRIVNADQFDIDVATNMLPDFSMYTPNLVNDGHNTNVHVAATFMEKKFGALLRDANFMRDKLFVLTFDESENYLNNRIYTVLVGGNIVPGSQTSQALNHVSLLHLIEEQMQIGHIGYHDSHARLPDGIWQ